MTAPDPTIDLGVAICTFNSMRTIERTLTSVANLATRIVVVDSGSTDGTPETCRAHGAHVVHQPWLGYVAQRQFAIDRCAGHRWILALDSDESLEPELCDSIREFLARDPGVDGWYINRKIWFLNGWLHHTFQPEWRLRLFRSGRGRVVGMEPHDSIVVDGPTARLKGDLRHDSWADLTDMATRQIKYAQIAAQGASRGGSTLNILFSPPAAMLKQFVIKRGFLDGWRGIVAAGMTANSTMLKHVHVAAMRRQYRSTPRT